MKQAGSENSNDRESSSTIKVIQATPCWLHARATGYSLFVQLLHHENLTSSYVKIIYLPIFSKASSLSSSVKLCNLLGKVSTWFHLNRFSPKHHSHPCRWRQLWSVVPQPAAVPIDESLVSTVDMVGTWKVIDKSWVRVIPGGTWSMDQAKQKKRTIIIQGKFKIRKPTVIASVLHLLGIITVYFWNILYFTRPLQFDFV